MLLWKQTLQDRSEKIPYCLVPFSTPSRPWPAGDLAAHRRGALIESDNEETNTAGGRALGGARAQQDDGGDEVGVRFSCA